MPEPLTREGGGERGHGFHNLWREPRGHHITMHLVVLKCDKIFVYSIHFNCMAVLAPFYVLNPWPGVIIKIHHLSSGLQEHHKHAFSFSATTAKVEIFYRKKRLYAVSLYGHIGPPVGPEPPDPMAMDFTIKVKSLMYIITSMYFVFFFNFVCELRIRCSKIRFNAFSLYGPIGPTIGSEPLTINFSHFQ